ncbi:NAD-dependent epimerase/dehydratase family protein [Micromonospora sp. NPDC048898]|uniref:NAD-dependent epimerase/dehydratase family protein n=1 Tax=Micromonospora sp. NPDC048898 TaxID=3364260 RepID=UPI003724608A
MRLLVLGGTGFVGGATVTEAVRRGWSVTVFNRGLHGTVPPGVHRLRGDRGAPDGLAALAGGEWDLLVDIWDGAPRAAGDAARALVDAVGHYVYVSSGSVYADPAAAGLDEDSPVVDADPDSVDGDYPQLKSGAERAVREVFGQRALVARAGLILGPGEDIGRLPWWLRRVERGGDVLAPGPADLPVQYIDVRDLAGWMLDAGAERVGGTFNAIGRRAQTTMGELLGACVAVTGADARLCWTDPASILAAGVQPWSDLPIWLPVGHPYRGLLERDVTRVFAAGLTCRPVVETVEDTWRWLREVGTVPPRAGRPDRGSIGLAPAREAAVLSG